MKILVCGGRDYADAQRVREVLAWFPTFDSELAHGAARGADLIAADVARSFGWNVTAFPADWAAHGKGAGPRRNQRMLDEFKPDVVIAFPGGRGTADMVARARKAGVEVREIAP